MNLEADRKIRETEEMESLREADQSHMMGDHNPGTDQTKPQIKLDVLSAVKMVIGKESVLRTGTIRETRTRIQAQ